MRIVGVDKRVFRLVVVNVLIPGLLVLRYARSLQDGMIMMN
jgi:hypothetical protein